jgi:hypothetical protein
MSRRRLAMWHVGDFLWELIEGVRYRRRCLARRFGGSRWVVNERPAVIACNLLTLNMIRAVADRLPCELVLSPANILNYVTLDWPQAGRMSRMRTDADRVWRLFNKGSKRYGAHAELLIGNAGIGRALRVDVAIVRQVDALRMRISENNKPLTAEEMALPTREFAGPRL